MSSASKSDEVKKVKNLVRSLLISAKNGVLMERINKDYREMIGENIPFRRLGYPSLEDFFQYSPDMCRISRQSMGFVLYPKVTEETAHVAKMVAAQSKGKKPGPIGARKPPKRASWVPPTVRQEILAQTRRHATGNGKSGGGTLGNLSRHAQDIRSSHLKMKNNNPPIRKPAIQGTSLKMPSMVPLGAAANFPRSPRPIETVESNKQPCVIAVANPIDQKDQKSASNKSTVPTSPASTEELMKKICELIGDRSNGVWSTCVAVEFRKKFKTELPNDWIKRIQSLKNSSNILKFVQHIGDIYIVYVAVPSSEEKNEVTPPPIISEPRKMDLPKETTWDVYITNIYADRVCLRILGEQYSARLDEMVVKMEEKYRNVKFLHPQEIIVGQYYGCRFEGEWFRVKVKEINEPNVTAYFIDHGDNEIIKANELVALLPEFLELAPQAIFVKLVGLEDLVDDLTFDVDNVKRYLIYEALGQTLVSELHSKDDRDIYVVLYNTQGTEDININENVLRSFKPENFETDCLSVGKGGDADLNNNNNGGDVEKVSNDSFAAKEIEALLANAKDQEQQILQKDQKIVLLERKIEALICENRNIAAVADEKDEKFRQMEQRFKKLEEEEKAKAKVHQDLTTSLMNVQDDIEKKLANNDLTIKAKLEEILQKDQKIASLEKQVEDLQKAPPPWLHQYLLLNKNFDEQKELIIEKDLKIASLENGRKDLIKACDDIYDDMIDAKKNWLSQDEVKSQTIEALSKDKKDQKVIEIFLKEQIEEKDLKIACLENGRQDHIKAYQNLKDHLGATMAIVNDQKELIKEKDLKISSLEKERKITKLAAHLKKHMAASSELATTSESSTITSGKKFRSQGMNTSFFDELDLLLDHESKHDDVLIEKDVIGSVLWFSKKSGCGYIKLNNSQETLFVHQTSYRYLRPGELVTFDIAATASGKKISNLSILQGQDPFKGTPYADNTVY